HGSIQDDSLSSLPFWSRQICIAPNEFNLPLPFQKRKLSSCLCTCCPEKTNIGGELATTAVPIGLEEQR
uniref:hypothetical protein n=1 Tax=Candidatus Fervidibacter sp. TaxID=3100871 RepID=UPI004049CC2E